MTLTRLAHATIMGASLTVLAWMTAGPAVAGVTLRTRASCKLFAKYRVNVDVEQITYSINGSGQITSTITLLCKNSDTGCGFADASCTGVASCGTVTVRGRVGSGGPIRTIPTKPCNTVFMGHAFLFPISLPLSDTLGTSSATLTTTVAIDSVSGNTVLSGFTGELTATAATRHGAVYRAVLWRATSDGDSALRPEKVEWEASVRLIQGQVITTGAFQPADFTITDMIGVDGDTVRTVRPVPGLTKSVTFDSMPLSIATGNSDNRLELAEFGSVGFGTYDPNFIFDPPPPATAPLLYPAWCGALIVLLAALGMIGIKSKRGNTAGPI